MRPDYRWRAAAGLLAAVLLLAFLALAREVVAGHTRAADLAVMARFSGCEHSRLVRAVAIALTFSLEFPPALMVVVPVVVALALRGHYRESALAGTMPLAALALSALAKDIVRRVRPPEQLFYASGLSFPSGHALVGAAFYGALVYIVWQHVPVRRVRIVSAIALLLIAFAIGLSRFCLRDHYPSDVLGGWLLGTSLLLSTLALLHGHRAPRTPPPTP